MRLCILGICGTFMANLAIIARELGCSVVGMDAHTYPPMSDVLAQAAIPLIEGYEPQSLPDEIDLVIVGNVIRETDPIVTAVRARGIPMTSGPAWLAREVLANRQVIAVSGTHGKTTTTAMIVHLLQAMGENPGYLIGGVNESLSQAACLGDSPYFVIEADEYDTAFFDKRAKLHHYPASMWVVNNLEFDHADIYDSMAQIESVFLDKLMALDDSAVVIYAADDTRVCRLIAQRAIQAVGVGLAQGEVRAVLTSPDGSCFSVNESQQEYGHCDWDYLGSHNVLNALAAVTAVSRLGYQGSRLVTAMASFSGVRRRLECLGCFSNVTLYDDFAHHPTAIQLTIAALRQKIGKARLVVVIYFASNSMRQGVHEDEAFVQALAPADLGYFLSGGEMTYSLRELAEKMPISVNVPTSKEALLADLQALSKPGDYLLFMGNKSLKEIQAQLSGFLKNRLLTTD